MSDPTQTDRARLLSPQDLPGLEADLSALQYKGIPIGATLNDFLVIHFLWGDDDTRRRTTLLNRARSLRHWLVPLHASALPAAAEPDRILLTWQDATPRFDELMLPIVDALGASRCQALMARQMSPAGLPGQVPAIVWEDVMLYRPQPWRKDYALHARRWHRRLRRICDEYHLPAGAFEFLAFRLLRASQWIDGSFGMLERLRPPLVLTEYDRNHRWSCLVLVARQLGIPTVTLVHGVMPPQAVGFAPVLADLVVCWGDADRAKLAAAGVPTDRIVIGGCPRLTRELPVDSQHARLRLGLDPQQPVVLLATSPDRGHLELAETFCDALERMPGATGVVRLHPAETLKDYAFVMDHHPAVNFLTSTAGSLEESLAAADVVVVRGSGVGGDALLKRRPVVVLSPEGELRGSDVDLVHEAGCPLATTADELCSVLKPMIGADPHPGDERAERYLAGFCRAYGAESAGLIANAVEGLMRRRRSTSAETDV